MKLIKTGIPFFLSVNLSCVITLRNPVAFHFLLCVFNAIAQLSG